MTEAQIGELVVRFTAILVVIAFWQAFMGMQIERDRSA